MQFHFKVLHVIPLEMVFIYLNCAYEKHKKSTAFLDSNLFGDRNYHRIQEILMFVFSS